MKKKKSIKCLSKIFLCACLLISFGSQVVAQPPPPQEAPGTPVPPPPATVQVIPPPPPRVRLAAPPPGRVWVQINRRWTLVVAPPADVPYLWAGNRWSIAPPLAVEGYEWVPGYWYGGYWYPGHWAVLKAPGPGMVWVHGYWEGLAWHPGYWRGPHPRGYEWAPGYRDPRGRWHRGHWGRPPGPHRP